MPLYLAVTPDHLPAAMALTPHLAHVAYRVTVEGTLLAQDLPSSLRGGLMVVECTKAFPAAAAGSLARAMIDHCLQRSFSGIVLDTPGTAGNAMTALARQLQPLCAAYRRQLYLPEQYADAVPGSTVLICTALSGGSLSRRLEDACARHGAERIALDLQRLAMEFPLPCPTGVGTPLSTHELHRQMQGAAVYYCSELCARYFTRHHRGSTRFVLFDDADTLRRKRELAQALGIADAFVMWPEVEDIAHSLFDAKKAPDTKKEGEP